MVKTLIFDFDGTIADSFMNSIHIINNLADKYNYEKFDTENIEKFRNLPIKEFVKSLKVPFWKLPFILKSAKKLWGKEEPKPIKGILPVLKKLNEKGYSLGILTSNSVDNVKKFLEKYDLDMFDFIYSGGLFGKHKKIKKIMKKHKISKDEFYYFGDETRDVDACEKAKVKCVSVSWGYNTKELLKKYNDNIIEKPKEIFEIINKI